MIRHDRPTWRDIDGTVMTERLFITGPGDPTTLDDVIGALLAAGAFDSEVINVHSAAFIWARPATAEESEKREQARRVADDHRESWERMMYERLHEKYGQEVG